MEQIEKKERAELRESNGGEISTPHRHDHSSPAHMVDGGETSGARLLITLAINLLIPAAQIIGGVYAHSMALISDSQVVGYIKGKSAIHIARKYMGRNQNFTGQKFWARGYCVSTTGRDEEIVRQYIKNQQELDRRIDQLSMF